MRMLSISKRLYFSQFSSRLSGPYHFGNEDLDLPESHEGDKGSRDKILVVYTALALLEGAKVLRIVVRLPACHRHNARGVAKRAGVVGDEARLVKVVFALLRVHAPEHTAGLDVLEKDEEEHKHAASAERTIWKRYQHWTKG